MKVSKSWLKELVEIRDIKEVERLLPSRTISTKEVTDRFIELDMKGYNRADLLSLRGVALEVAALTDGKVNFEDRESEIEEFGDLEVEIEDKKDSPLYCLVKIEGLKVENSPKDWVKKLADSGMRSVNNVADITNLVMIEFGQPMHAFDASSVKDETIIVRIAKNGEAIETLDSKKRQLQEDDILITDTEKILGIAGVMGGKNSEVSGETHTILLEAAIFNPRSIRKTSQRLGLASEASKRFYHGLTKKRLFQALEAAINMYQGLGGKVSAVIISDSYIEGERKVRVRAEKINSIIGVELPKDQIENYLKRLNFTLNQVEGEHHWEVGVPYWRLDIEIEEDIIEEVARMYGYEKIPAKQLEGTVPQKIDQSLFQTIDKFKKACFDIGLTEVQTYSFYSTDVLNNLNIEKKDLIKVANPISSETEYMRQSIWANLIEVLTKNTRLGVKDIAIFEVGKTYWKTAEKLPEEKYSLAIALINGDENPVLELNGILERLDKKLNLGLKVENVTPPGVVSRIFHPKRFYSIDKGGKTIGGMAEVHPRVTNKFGVEKRVAILEFFGDKLISL